MEGWGHVTEKPKSLSLSEAGNQESGQEKTRESSWLHCQDGWCLIQNGLSLNSVGAIQSPSKESDGHMIQPVRGRLTDTKESMEWGKMISQRKWVLKEGEKEVLLSVKMQMSHKGATFF